MTQQEKILDYIERFGSITPMQAFADLGITKLATRVSELKQAGCKIEGTMTKAKNRFGQPVRFMKYRMEVEA